MSTGTDAAPIYLDHHATTPCDPAVVQAMAPYWSEEFGNAASRTHAFGWRAAEAVDRARRQVAALIGADAREIVFTSGATEADNLALLGALRHERARGERLLTCATEHKAVLDPAEALRREGRAVEVVGVDGSGRIDPDRFARALDERTALVSLMHANNEIGLIHDLAELARPTRAAGALFHSDAAQSAGRIPVDVRELGVDLLSLSAHKLYGPKGVGALWVRRARPALPLAPLLHGGGHERGLRSGTLPVALIVGFGVACEIAAERLERDAREQSALRDRLWQRLQAAIPGVLQNGDPERRLPGNLNLSLPGVDAAALCVALPDVAISSGSACTSAVPEASHVLRALGLDPVRAAGAIRIGLGRGNTADDVDRAAEAIAETARKLRGR